MPSTYDFLSLSRGYLSIRTSYKLGPEKQRGFEYRDLCWNSQSFTIADRIPRWMPHHSYGLRLRRDVLEVQLCSAPPQHRTWDRPDAPRLLERLPPGEPDGLDQLPRVRKQRARGERARHRGIHPLLQVLFSDLSSIENQVLFSYLSSIEDPILIQVCPSLQSHPA
jgi:hypothetical protein